MTAADVVDAVVDDSTGHASGELLGTPEDIQEVEASQGAQEDREALLANFEACAVFRSTGVPSTVERALEHLRLLLDVRGDKAAEQAVRSWTSELDGGWHEGARTILQARPASPDLIVAIAYLAPGEVPAPDALAGALEALSQVPAQLQQAHDQLAAHFESLRQGRAAERPVYLLEHCDVLGGADLVELVARALRQHPPHSVWWRTRYLPLLVLAAKAGYEYEGPGKDFWDRFGTSVRYSFEELEDRRAMSELFALAVIRFGAAIPAQSPWAKQFCHIAWPITHAVLPKDLQRALTASLANLRLAVTPETPVERVREALEFVGRDHGGTRFQHWLRDADLVGGLVHELLAPTGGSWLRQELVDQIRCDIEANEAANAEYRRAIQRQATILREEERTGARRPKAGDVRWGQLLLRQTLGEQYSLHAQFPALPANLLGDLRTALKGRRWLPRLFGKAEPVRADRVLTGYPLPLLINSFPEPDAPTFPDLGDQSLPASLVRELTSVRFELKLPLIFAVDDEGATQVRHGRDWGDGRLLILFKDDGTQPKDTILCQVAGLSCRSVDAAAAREDPALRAVGSPGRSSGASLRWAGDPPLRPSSDAADLLFSEGDVVAVRAALPQGQEGVLSAQGESIAICETGVVLADSDEAQRGVELRSVDVALSLKATRGSVPEPTSIVWAQVTGGETIQALLQRRLTIRVESLVPLEDVPLRVTLRIGGGALASVEEHLFSTPGVVGREARLWSRLLEVTPPDIHDLAQVHLAISLGALWHGEWPLRQELSEFWWEGETGATPTPFSEDGALPVVVRSMRTPLVDTDVPPDALEEVGLYLPRADGVQRWGGLCRGPTTLSLDWDAPPSPRLLRQVESRQSGVGLLQLLESYLLWSLASAAQLVVEVRRRQVQLLLEQWCVRALCGDGWEGTERALLRIATGDAHAGLVAVCKEASDRGTPLGFDGYLKLNDEQANVVTPLFVRGLRRTFPDLDALLRRPDSLKEAGTIEALNGVFNTAYRELAALFPGDAAQLQSDVWNHEAEWRGAFAEAERRLILVDLVDQLWPTEGAEELIDLDYGEAPVQDLVALLSDWGRRQRARGALRGAPWDQEHVHAAVAIWIDPASAVTRPWRACAPRLAVDRGFARAIRYVGLRYRLARFGSAS